MLSVSTHMCLWPVNVDVGIRNHRIAGHWCDIIINPEWTKSRPARNFIVGFCWKGRFKSEQLKGGAQHDWAMMGCGKIAKATLIF